MIRKLCFLFSGCLFIFGLCILYPSIHANETFEDLFIPIFCMISGIGISVYLIMLDLLPYPMSHESKELLKPLEIG